MTNHVEMDLSRYDRMVLDRADMKRTYDRLHQVFAHKEERAAADNPIPVGVDIDTLVDRAIKAADRD